MAKKTDEELTKELELALAKNKSQASQISDQTAQIEDLAKELAQTKEQIILITSERDLSVQEKAKLEVMLRQRNDELSGAAEQLKTAYEEIEALKQGQASIEVEELITFAASWKDPKGKTVNRKVKINIPKIRLPSGEVVFSHSLLKIAVGKELNEVEENASPELKGMTQTAAAEILNKWAKINAGFMQDV